MGQHVDAHLELDLFRALEVSVDEEQAIVVGEHVIALDKRDEATGLAHVLDLGNLGLVVDNASGAYLDGKRVFRCSVLDSHI